LIIQVNVLEGCYIKIGQLYGQSVKHPLGNSNADLIQKVQKASIAGKKRTRDGKLVESKKDFQKDFKQVALVPCGDEVTVSGRRRIMYTCAMLNTLDALGKALECCPSGCFGTDTLVTFFEPVVDLVDLFVHYSVAEREAGLLRSLEYTM
jgi:hypothetical protein